ncbi:MAG TPA: DUF4397 domain-containing protein [Pedobacter sp.]|uniref:DUF4397 domain-containing protein n=1 Tax=Pedobacter sp. TaxID=1411316 RepID=UPI002C15863A|nr:DUF4397 domain-containing protein [Pedobacter sp.]HMI04010.1 DUF4397 domain-containing protein [Pedobacter sp.]
MKKILILLIAGLVIQSCKKEESSPALASITVVNAAIDVAAAKAYASDKQVYWSAIPAADAVNFASSKHFGVFTGSKNVIAVNSADTTKTLYRNSSEFNEGGLNTLFLCGQTGSYEGVYLADEVLPNYTEEVVGIRFINLSPNSPAISVNLTATPTVNEASGVAYKQKSEFKIYPASTVTTGIAFQVKNATTGDLLAKYNLPATAVSPYTTATVAQARLKNVTLVIKGLVGGTGTNAFGVFPVPHY